MVSLNNENPSPVAANWTGGSACKPLRYVRLVSARAGSRLSGRGELATGSVYVCNIKKPRTDDNAAFN